MVATKTHAPAAAKAVKTPPPAAATEAAAPQPDVVNPAWSVLATQVQAKLTVSAPDDPHEREADEMADRVMRMPDARPGHAPAPDQWLSAGSLAVQRKCSACEEEEEEEKAAAPEQTVQRMCDSCAEEKEEETVATVQRKAIDRQPPRQADELVHRVTAAPGRPLEPEHRGYFEQRFNADFSRVRIHTGGDASRAAKAVHARAFTAGPNVAFADGEYSPASSGGRRLMAHELTHVAQQGHAPALVNHRGHVASASQPMARVSTATPGVQRDPLDDPDLKEQLDEEIGFAEEDAESDNAVTRIRAVRLVFLYQYTGKPALTSQTVLDDYIEDINTRADTEIGTMSHADNPFTADFALDTIPEGFPLTWAALIRMHLSLGVDGKALLTEWKDSKEALITSAKTLSDDIYENGLPVPLDDPSRLANFKLRLSDAKASNSTALASFAKESIAFIKLQWVVSFAMGWETAVENFAVSIEEGDTVVDVTSYTDWRDNFEAKLIELPERARARLAMTEEEVTQLETDGTSLDDAAVAIGMFSGLMSIFGILGAWSTCSDLFDEALKGADKKVAGADGGDRLIKALKWGWANSYYSGAAAEWVQNLIAHGPEILLEIGIILALGMIPGVQIGVAIYLALTLARDVLHMIGETAQAIADCTAATSVAQLQLASMRLARALVNGGIFILIVLATEGIGRAASRLRKEAAQLRKADPLLTEEAAMKKAMEKMPKEERAALETGPAKVAKKFETEIGAACSLGSINCRVQLPSHIEAEAGAYPTAHGVPKPGGPFNVQKAALVGAERGTQLLRDRVLKNPSTHTPEFTKALAAAKKQHLDWPDGWEVHHIKPVFMGGDSVYTNLIPLPKATHQLYTNWWNAVGRSFKKRFTAAEWDDIYWNVTSKPGSSVPKTPVR